MDGLKIALLLAVVLLLSLTLDAGWLYPREDELPRLYLSVDRIRPYEEYGSLTVFDGQPMRDIGALVKKRGNSTITADKPSYSVRFYKKASLLGMDANRRWILLGTPYDKTMLRTTLGFEYARAIGMEGVSQTAFCDLYVRGEYQGLYILTEPVTMDGLGLDASRGDFILERNLEREKEDSAFVITDGGLRFELNAGAQAPDVQACLEIVNRAERAMRSGDETQYAQYIDVDSFVNAYIAQEVTKHIDFARSSDRYYVRDGVLCAGPLWDMDLSMGNVSDKRSFEPHYRLYHNAEGDGDGSGDSASAFWAQRDWFAWLCGDPAFMQRVRERWREVYPVTENLVRDNALGQNRIDAIAASCAAGLASNYDEDNGGWSLGRKYSDLECGTHFETYGEAVEFLRDWLTRRIDWLDAQFAQPDGEGTQ